MARPPPKASFLWTGFRGGVACIAVVDRKERRHIAVGTKKGRIILYDEQTKLKTDDLYEDLEQRSIVAINSFRGSIMVHVRCFAIIKFLESTDEPEVFCSTAHYGHCPSFFGNSLLIVPNLMDKTNILQLFKESETTLEPTTINLAEDKYMLMCMYFSISTDSIFVGWDSGCLEQISCNDSRKITSIKLCGDPIFAICSTASSLFVASSTSPIYILELQDRTLVNNGSKLDYNPSAGGCSCLQLTPSQKTMFAAFWDGSLRGYNVKQKAIMLCIQVSQGLPIQCLCVSENRKVYSGDDEERVLSWDF